MASATSTVDHATTSRESVGRGALYRGTDHSSKGSTKAPSTTWNTLIGSTDCRPMWLPLLLIPAAVVIVGGLLMFTFLGDSRGGSSAFYCSSPACKKFAFEVSRLRQDNRTTSPCDNFYNHACRHWSEAGNLYLSKGYSYDDHVRYTILQGLADSLNRGTKKSDGLFRTALYEIFTRCMQRRGSATNREFSEALGELGLQFPILPGSQPPTTLGIAAGRMARHTGLMPFFRVKLIADRGRTGPGTQILLTVGDEMGVPHRIPPDVGARTFALMNRMNRRFKDAADAEAVWRIERNRRTLLNMSQDDDVIYEQMTVEELSRRFNSPELEWSFEEYLHTIFDEAINSKTIVLIKNVAYVTELSKFLAQDHALFLSSYANYVCLHLLLHYAPYLHDADAHYFLGLLRYPWSTLPGNSMLCARMAETAVPLGAHLLFAERVMARLGHKDIQRLSNYTLQNVRDLSNALDSVYAVSSYSSERTRVKIFHKLRQLRVHTFLLEEDTKAFEDVVGGNISQVLSEGAVTSAVELNSRLWNTHWSSLRSGSGHYLKLGYLPSVLDLYSNYVPEFNTLFVSLGAMGDGFLEGDDAFELDKVRMGYRIMHGLVGILLDDAEMWSWSGDLDDAQDFYAARKIEQVRLCLNYSLYGSLYESGRRTDFKLDEAFRSLSSITPLYRFFRKKIFQQVYPQSEFRIQPIPGLTENEMFFYSLGKSLCSRDDKALVSTQETEKLVNIVLANCGPMFNAAFRCKLSRDCNFFPTTRHSYI
ncbi:uncharacterized protein LOC135371007 [Ornithodoros turicata]|uniref:uncharacterized protein LOC135371007 n=1 Tax=Ornithodoros turicata TaxID=34597 RepID=UPI003139B067